ncbi:MAG: hypothetical protein RR500_07965 [Bacilli bacterium]
MNSKVLKLLNPKIVFNEKTNLDNMIVTKDFNSVPLYQVIYLLSRYYLQADNISNSIDREVLSKKEVAVKEQEKTERVYAQICNSMKYRMTEYERIRYEDRVKKQITQLVQKGFRQISDVNYIEVFKEEIDYIHKINNLELEKLVFSILCYIKYNIKSGKSNSHWCNSLPKNYFESANLKKTRNEQNLMLRELIDMGLIKVSFKISNLSFEAVFIEDLEKIEHKTTAYTIDNFESLGMLYLKFIGNNIISCIECGKLTENKKNEEWVLCNSCKRKEKYKNYKSMKSIVCSNCGKIFLADMKANNKTRCDKCQYDFRKDTHSKYNQKRNNDKSN